MDTAASFISMLLAMMLVMALGFLKLLGNVEPILLFYVFIALLVISSLLLKVLSYKVNIVKQYDVVISIEPKGNSNIFAALYKVISMSNSILCGALCGSILLVLARNL